MYVDFHKCKKQHPTKNMPAYFLKYLCKYILTCMTHQYKRNQK